MKRLQSWRLFWLLALAVSVVICLRLPSANFHSTRGMEPIILFSVRCALPLFIVAFTASSLASLWPGPVTRWLLANRRYFGLAFAWGMGWHLAFVGYSIVSFGNPLNRTALTLDLIGFTFLLALTLTSFNWSARLLGATNWRRLHKTGVYVIWLLATYIFFGFARGDRDLFHIGMLMVLLGAWGLRVVAGGMKWLARRNGGRQLPHNSAL